MTPSPKRHDPDEFGIEVAFTRHSDAPARVFRAVTALLDAFQEIDGFLAKSVRTTIHPTSLLEDIEAGSLRVWLRNVLQAVDDDALKSGEWKKVVGVFLVRAKRIMVEWTEGKTEVTSEAELTDLQQSILEEAARTGVLPIPVYVPVPASEIARSVELIAGAIEPLSEGDTIAYLSGDDPPVEISRSFHVTPDSLTELLVKESLVNEGEMNLIIKRPDFLGESRWDFRHGGTPIPAKMDDSAWMDEFRNGNVALFPGDALRAIVRTTVRYGYDAEVVDTQYEVIKVIRIIQAARPSQGDLLLGQ